MPDPTAPERLPTPEELTELSMKMMRQLIGELHQLNGQLKLNFELSKEMRDILVSNANVTDELGKLLVRLIEGLESVDDVLDLHATAMENLKDDTAGQSRITISDYARAWWAAMEEEDESDGDGPVEP